MTKGKVIVKLMDYGRVGYRQPPTPTVIAEFTLTCEGKEKGTASFGFIKKERDRQRL